VRNTSDPAFEQRVRARAYQIWQEEGRPDGRDVEHWIRAVLEIAREDGIEVPPPGVLQTDGRTGDASDGRRGPRGGS